MNSGNFMLLFLLPFIAPIIMFVTMFAVIKNAAKTRHNGNNDNYTNNGSDFFTTVKDAFEKHSSNADDIQSSKKPIYTYQDKPEEDYCDGSERSCDLINKEEPIAITSVLDDSDVNFETRLNRLSEDMDNAGCYNLASKDEMKKAVIYSEIINKKY